MEHLVIDAVTADFQACIEDGTVSQIVRHRTTVALTFVTFTVALKFCLRLVSPRNSWMMMDDADNVTTAHYDATGIYVSVVNDNEYSAFCTVGGDHRSRGWYDNLW